MREARIKELEEELSSAQKELRRCAKEAEDVNSLKIGFKRIRIECEAWERAAKISEKYYRQKQAELEMFMLKSKAEIASRDAEILSLRLKLKEGSREDEL